MRAWSFVAAAAMDRQVDVVVVPIAGALPAGEAPLPPGVSLTMAPSLSPEQLRAGFVALLGDPAWRDRWSATAPLPGLARLAPPSVAGAIAERLDGAGGSAVHVMRSYLAPLGLALASELHAPWATLDLDDDDEQLLAALGEGEESASYRRLVGAFGPAFDRVCLASETEAADIASRHGLPTWVIPNCVPAPHHRPPRRRHHRPGHSLLFIGNLTYGPNMDAAVTLVEEVLPRLGRVVDGPVEVTLVGDTGGAPEIIRLGDRPGVRVAGFVADVAPYYQAADVVVVPLAAGAGTRIKLLEAFAHGVPVVSSPVAAKGLAARPGVHLLMADGPDALAEATSRVLLDDRLGPRLTAAARELTEHSYSQAAVFPRIRQFLAPR